MVRPMYYEEKPKEPIKAYTGKELHCKSWEAEAALRMLQNNITPGVALVPDELIVYGGTGRAARNWREFNNIVRALKNLEQNETLLVQSGKPVGIFETFKHSPRVLIANSNIVPSHTKFFDKYDEMGLMMYGQMTAGSWIYIGTQGILQGTFETYASVADKHFGGSLKGKFLLTSGMGNMSGAQPLAGVMNGAAILVVEVRPERIEKKLKEGYCDKMTYSLDEALEWINAAKDKREALSVGLVGNAAEVYPELVKRNIMPDIVSDQTPAHNLIDYVPIGKLDEVLELKEKNLKEYEAKIKGAIKKQVSAMIEFQKRGAVVFDYGNGIRGQAENAGLSEIRNSDGSFAYPGFVQAYVRPLFCEGKGPFRWAALSGNTEDIYKIDDALMKLFPEDKVLHRWLTIVREKLPFEKLPGLPTRVCWLGYGDRAKAGVMINNMVRDGILDAPVVIGRDHLDCGSVASPERETEGMKDGSDAIADWPILNALLNTAAGADWVSFHNGGGVGIGKSLHAGMVIVATGTKEKEERLKKVLTADPGTGIMRHADAGYETAIDIAKKKGIKIPSLGINC